MEEKKAFTGIKQKLAQLLQGENKIKLIVLVGVLGVALILLSEFMPKQTQKTDAAGSVGTNEEYITRLEDKIYQLVTSIEGVGRAKVLVTLESGVEYVYASAEKKNTDVTQDYSDEEVKKLHEKGNSESNYILVDGGNGKEALIKTQIEPTVKGVVVVCEGADNYVVEERVINAVTTALDLSSAQVCISKMAAGS